MDFRDKEWIVRALGMFAALQRPPPSSFEEEDWLTTRAENNATLIRNFANAGSDKPVDPFS